MFDTTTAPDTAKEVLASVRERRAAANRAEADLLALAVAWADLHPAESITHAACFADTPLAVAGPGAPLVAEFCVAEFAAAMNLPTETGKTLLGQAVELRYRLPKTYARTLAGDLAAWKARRIAAETLTLTVEAAAHVDAHLAPYAHRIRPAELERLLAYAVAHHMPAEAETRRRRAAETRHLDIDTRTVSFDGTCQVTGTLDLADALDLDTALATTAATLRVLGSPDPLDVRRSVALGEIARHQLALDLTAAEGEVSTSSTTGAQVSTRSSTGRRGVKVRQVVIHAHTFLDSPTARIEARGRHLAAVAQVKTWCADPDTHVVITPVIDLRERLHIDAYEIPGRLIDHVDERDHACVFPWCTHPARTADHDHITPYADGGPTDTDNLAALCRHHHRLKTHTGWTYTMIEPGTYLWTTPHGLQLLRDPHGTTTIT